MTKPKHNEMTHFPKDPDCWVCRNCKTQRARCGTKNHGGPDDLPEPKKFADAITADHAIISEADKGLENERTALIVLDRFTRWLQGYAGKGKSGLETMKNKRICGAAVHARAYLY